MYGETIKNQAEGAEQSVPFEEAVDAETLARIDREFEDFVEGQLTSVKSKTKADMEAGKMDAAAGEALIEEKRQEYLSKSEEWRATRVVNNFRFWLPGGYYRSMLEESEEDDGMDHSHDYEKKQLIQDLDALIEESGFQVVAREIAEASPQERIATLPVEVDLYFKMEDRGYGHDALAA